GGSAGKRAFVTTRVGDFGFMIAMCLMFSALGSLQYGVVLTGAATLTKTTATAIALLLFLGAVGKSAQLPLYVWLPDAMEGPTPVSALIHAATMVTAGVYLMARVNPILAEAPGPLTLIAAVGAATALFAATFIVGWLAIAGVPPFAGFWSKDDILVNAWEKNHALWAIGLVTALLTAYYMSRQVFLVFFGRSRWQEAAGHPGREPHESPWT